MTKIKGLILCSGGYSSSIIASRLNELGASYNLLFDEGGHGQCNIASLANDYQLVLIAPHLSMYFDEYEDELLDKNVPVIQIKAKEYVASNVDSLFTRVKETIGL